MEREVELQDGELILRPVKTLGRTFYPTADLERIDLEKIRTIPCGSRVISALQPQISKVKWNVGPGRNIGILVLHGEKLIGVLNLSSPVIVLGARDEHLDLPSDNEERGHALKKYLDVSVCVALQPFSWRSNAGKLLALIATTCGDYYDRFFGGELEGVTTTSYWGKSIQYDRVYDHIGYTKGYGAKHIPKEKYEEMVDWLNKHSDGIHDQWSSPKLKTVEKYVKESGDDEYTSFHGHQRGVYYSDARPPGEREEVIQYWWDRWGKRRWEKKKDEDPPYNNGLTSEPVPVRWGNPIHVEGAKSPPQHEVDSFF